MFLPLGIQSFILLLLLAFTAYGQQKDKVAIINTVDDGSPAIPHSELSYLTKKLRGIAINTLPQKNYDIMTDDYIIDISGSQVEAEKKCEEAGGCLAKLGREIKVHYIAQARIGRLGKDLTITTELYDTRSSKLLGSLEGVAKDVYGLISELEKKAPEMFKKMLGTSNSRETIPSGISGLEKTKDYELGGEKNYLVNLSTEPSGAILSFDGLPSPTCPKTPCKSELREGNVRIIAALEQYERADTTIFVSKNNQSVAIKLKPNFGILEIRPDYLDGIGKKKEWSLSINDKFYDLGEIRLSPNKYAVKLDHECYENISFNVGINKGSREVFDMASNIKLKKGGLALSAERAGEPVSEPVFINGTRIGETPFSDAVPLCSDIRIGDNKEEVDVTLKYNENVEYTYRGDLYTPTQKTPLFKNKLFNKTSFWLGLGLEVAGAIFLYLGYDDNDKMMYWYNDYANNTLIGFGQENHDRNWKQVEDQRNERNMHYTIGSILLASGIGVHIWF